jgi:peptidoglycan/LPS O-acetylase OafA/YrhL
MSRSAIRAAVLVLIVLALTMFAGEAIHELHYADVHPSAYGPADVIALACGAGAMLALAAGVALLLLTPRDTEFPRIGLLVLIVAAVALGVWLVTLTAGSSGTGGSGLGGGSLGGLGLP